MGETIEAYRIKKLRPTRKDIGSKRLKKGVGEDLRVDFAIGYSDKGGLDHPK